MASEIANYYNEDDENHDEIIMMLTISNVSTAFLSTFNIIGDFLILLL